MERFRELKSELTVRSFKGDNRPFDMTDEDYMDCFKECPEWRNIWSERELDMLLWCEFPWWEYGGVNPYSQMDYDDWITLNKEAEEEFINEMIEKGIYEKK